MDKVVVFGGSGFIGSHLADALTENGYDVVIFDETYSPYIQENQTMVSGDILNQKSVQSVVRGARYVYHFAGIADIQKSSISPWQTMNINIMGTCNILEACMKAGTDRFVFASSMYVYSEVGSFYRVSKQSCEKIIEEYAKEFDLKYTILRFGSVYGPRANQFNSISKMLNQAFTEGRIVCNGDGEEVRQYIHVSDAVQECVNILDEKYRNKHLALIGNETLTLHQLMMIIKEIFDHNIEIEYLPRENIHHYRITPYSYKPIKALKLISKSYHDLGQGLLELFHEMEKQELQISR
ncbi:MAG: NAD(P)-dependent oxidoreductase [Desulfobacteraceae bacterium]|nr:NAD(P)-dependent oxidoreductase [Desulfobacteraceae bacterium]